MSQIDITLEKSKTKTISETETYKYDVSFSNESKSAKTVICLLVRDPHCTEGGQNFFGKLLSISWLKMLKIYIAFEKSKSETENYRYAVSFSNESKSVKTVISLLVKVGQKAKIILTPGTSMT